MFTGTGTTDSLLIILLASSILQFAAAFLSIRMIRHTGWRLSWLLIAAAIIGMTLRRLLGLAEAMPEHPAKSDYVFEWVGLIVSTLLLVGVALIKPLFESIKKNADKLARSEAMYKGLVQHASSLILRLSPNGTVTFANDYACRRLGVTQEDIRGKTLGEAVLPPLDSQGRDTGPVAALFFGHHEPMNRFECEIQSRDGSLTWVGWASTPIANRRGKIKEYLCVGLDISDRKDKERLREDVQSILRHDLKSPLAGIIGCAVAMQHGDNLDSDQRESLEAMEDAGTRLLEMINRDQDIYKLEAGLYSMQPAPVDVAAVIRKVTASLVRQMGRPVDIRMTIDGHPDTGESVVIQGEEMLLYSMFTNLVRNALEASNGADAVDIALATGPTLSVAVHNRLAVPEDFQPRFFEKFATLGKRHGTGLGTYGARLITEAHKGDITLHSNEADGTTVTVRLPTEPFGPESR